MLLPHHAALITQSAIATEVAAERGYYSATTPAELLALGFGEYQARAPALVIPVCDVSGRIALYQARPDAPRTNKNGKALKYETPAGARMVLDVPPRVRPRLGDPNEPLIVTEGARKADAAASVGLCCIALLGVDCWRGTNEQGGKAALACWDSIALNGRRALICFDSDVMTKLEVRRALGRLARFLESRGAHVEVVYLPDGEDCAKVGLDDYLAADHSAADLLALTRPLGGGVLPRDAEARPVVVSLASVAPQPVEWLWPGRIPRGKLTIIDGDPGLGKSSIALDLAARVSTGHPMPDGAPGGAGAVVLLTYEDDLADTVRPRLDGADADPTRIFAFSIGTEDGERLPELPRDLVALEHTVAEHSAVLIIIDPLMAALAGEVNAHRDQDVRRALAPLAKLAERTGAAVVVVRHLNKGGAAGSNPLYRGGGSIGIIGAARSGMLVARDPRDPERRVLAVTKANLAAPVPALGFRMVATERGLAVEWLGTTNHSAEELLAVPTDGEERSALEEASTFLEEALAAGPQPVKDLKRDARAAGIGDRTLDRARRALGAVARRQGFGRGAAYVWALPPDHARHARHARQPADHGEHGAHDGEHGVSMTVDALNAAAEELV